MRLFLDYTLSVTTIIRISHMQVVEGVGLIPQETLYGVVKQPLCTYVYKYIEIYTTSSSR